MSAVSRWNHRRLRFLCAIGIHNGKLIAQDAFFSTLPYSKKLPFTYKPWKFCFRCNTRMVHP